MIMMMYVCDSDNNTHIALYHNLALDGDGASRSLLHNNLDAIWQPKNISGKCSVYVVCVM